MITKKDKENIVKALQTVDVKKMTLENPDERLVKWFRFGSYNGLLLAQEIVKALPEGKKKKVTKIVVD